MAIPSVIPVPTPTGPPTPVASAAQAFVCVLKNLNSGDTITYIFSSQFNSDTFVQGLQANLALLPKTIGNNIAISQLTTVIDSETGF